MLFAICLVAFLGWSIAALSITALVLGVLPLLSTEKATAPKTGEKPVDTGRLQCLTCGSHLFAPVLIDLTRDMQDPPESDAPGGSEHYR